MKLFKSVVVYSLITILFILLFFLPKAVNLIPSKEVKIVILAIAYVLVFLIIILNTYGDISKKKYTTTIYIVLTDIIEIIAYAVMGYLSFMIYRTTNIEALLRMNNERAVSMMFLLGATIVRRIFLSQKFIHNN